MSKIVQFITLASKLQSAPALMRANVISSLPDIIAQDMAVQLFCKDFIHKIKEKN